VQPASQQELRNARWSAEKAWEWYGEVGPVFGCNYLPRTAVNTSEMWQEETFDPQTIDEELRWAAQAGYNSLRVFVQYLVWKHDPEGLKQRMERLLAIADEHGLHVMLVPFCDCAFAGRGPYPGRQNEPVPGVHNSGWVPSPGHRLVNDPSTWPDLERYIKDLVGHFRDDRRVLVWDLYNEPGMSGQGVRSLPLAVAAFQWARESQPTQPLTIGAYTNLEDSMSKTLMGLSDVVTFHGYDAPEGVDRKITICQQYGRPILCTEWLVRGRNNRFETILPLFAQERVGGYHWGLVAGRTQTYMPWGSKEGDPMPELWHHDTFRDNGTPYDPKEIALIDDFLLSGCNLRQVVPTSEEGPQTWRYTTEIPNYGWHLPDFDPSQPWRDVVWGEGPGGFGNAETPGAVVGTAWDTQNIWLRRTFELESADLRRPHLRIRHDEHAEVYVNGHLVAKLSGRSAGYQQVPLSRPSRTGLRPGTNVISVHGHQTTGDQFVDVGLVEVLGCGEGDGLAMPEASPPTAPVSAGTPWPAERARAWYAAQPPIRGCNFLPRTAINSVQMWRKETFDPKTIDEELGWAAAAGFNSVRVFLQYVVWADDPEGFAARFETFLRIADSHGITTMPVFFCDVCFAMKLEPILGPQDEPVFGIHNSGWVPSPGYSMVQDPRQWIGLRDFVRDVVQRHGQDRRVIVWDAYNEPGPYFDRTLSFPLAKVAMGWIRELDPIQPVTVAVWGNPSSREFLALSDVLSLHTYSGNGLEAFLRDAQGTFGRPLLVTECLARPAFGFDTMLPLFAEYNVGWYNWGLVAGRTQTNRAYSSREGDPRPTLWHHDVLRPDGTPYDARELDLIRSFEFEERTEHAETKQAERDTTELLPHAKQRPGTWRYTVQPPSDGWFETGFDDSRWTSGRAGFGTHETPNTAVGTLWDTPQIWLRRSFSIEEPVAGEVYLELHHDEDTVVYLNGVEAASVTGYNTGHSRIPVAEAAAATLQPGENTIAVHCRQTYGGQYVDVGLVTIRTGRWTAERATAWYAKHPWMVGCNFIPSTAINQLEMWQADTFDPETIDRELGWAAGLGMNVVRVYLHDLAYEQDPDGFLERIEYFLGSADSHGIATMFVIFDDCWLAEPRAGKQPESWPGVHNSGWLESPGLPQLERYPADAALRQRLEEYVKAVLSRFHDDPRVLMWDLYNEPGGWWYRRGEAPGSFEKGLTNDLCSPLLRDVYRWARQVDPSQPLTSCWNRGAFEVEAALRWADVVTFHHYGDVSGVEGLIAELRESAPDRPLVCTEYLFRQGDSRFQTHLPVFLEHGIGAINWGLVAGKTNTIWGWGSWEKPVTEEPEVWFHDVLRRDGTPFDEEEAAFLRSITKRGRAQRPDTVTPRSSSYRGWKSLLLENDLVRLQVVPQIGGRVIQYALGDKEFLWVNPALVGRTSPATGLDTDGGWLNYGGDKLWPAPQGWDGDEQWPGPPDAVLDGQPHRAVTDLEPAGIRLTSGDDPQSGIRFDRRIRVHPGSTRVSFEATMTNVDDEPRRWGIWAHTQLDVGLPDGDDYNRLMRAWCPINPHSHFDRGYDVIFGEEDNPSFEVDAERGLMQVGYRYQVGKIGLDSHAGWVATVDGRQGDVFVQRFEFDPELPYPDGSSVEFWHNGLGRIFAYDQWLDMPDDRGANPYVFESEILSPFARLRPGESYTWTYDWYACRIGGDHPVVDCSDVGVVSEPLTCRREGDRLRLGGRFGVFHQGRLVLELRDENAEALETSVLDTNATPLKPVVLDLELKLFPGVRSVAVVLQPAGREPGGEVDQLVLAQTDPLLLEQLDSPILLHGTDTIAYRDPAVLYHEKTFYLFPTIIHTEPNGRIFLYTGVSTSRDLKTWSEPRLITPRDQRLNYSSPGNVVRFGDEWVLCLQTYPIPGYERGDDLRWGSQEARIWIMRSKDLSDWGDPELLRVKGPQVPREEMGRMIDPYLIQDKDDPGKWWCFYKQQGVSYSWSHDLVSWTYGGRTDCGENVCVLHDRGEYLLFHSPANGIGMKRSPDLEHWRNVGGLITLGQKDWSWAEMRLTAGCVLDLRHEPTIGRYLMFFHGGGPGKTRTQANAYANCSIGLAWSDDLQTWDWPGKQ